jgi:phage baseplate assembly protein gpV
MSEALLTAGEARRNNRYEGISRVGIVIERRKGKTGPQVRIQYPDRGVASAWTPVAQRNTVGSKDYALPELGERVLVQHLANGPERGVVVGCVYNEAVSAVDQSDENTREVVFRDGTIVRYNPGEKAMTIEAAGTITIKAVTSLAVEMPAITIKGDITMEGKFTLDGIVLNTHKHTDVEAGSANTGEPVN